MPHLVTHEQRRVGGQRHLHARDRLGGVPRVREPVGCHLQVQLHGGAGGFRGDGFEVVGVLFVAAQVDLHQLAARFQDGVVQPGVAVFLGHPFVAVQKLRGHRRQRADHRQLRARLLRGVAHGGKPLFHPLGQPRQPVALNSQRRVVHLHVVGADLGLVLVAKYLQHRLVVGVRLHVAVHQVELELEPDCAVVHEVRVLQMAVEALQIVFKPAPVGGALARSVGLRRNGVAH